MNSYTLTLVLKPDLEETARRELLAAIAKKMDKAEKEDLWGVRDLAYPIKRNTKGYFVHLEVTADPGNIKGLDKSLELEEDVLRYLLIKR